MGGELLPWQVALHQRCRRPVATPLLVAANVLLFIVMGFAGAGILTPDPSVHIAFGSGYGPLTLGGEPWRLLTATFIHFGLLHLLFNMWALRDLGRLVEKLYGTTGFLLLYFFAGISGSLASLTWNPAVNGAGASGAIFGVMGALLAFVLRPGLGLPRVVVLALRRDAFVFTGLSLAMGLFVAGIDNAAHLGGLVAGSTMGWLLARPLDPEVGKRGSTARLAAGLLLATAVLGPGVWLVNNPPPRVAAESQFLRDIDWLATRDQEVVSGLSELAKLGRSGSIDATQFSQRVATELVPRWREAHERMLAHPLPAGSRYAPLQAATIDYVEARAGMLQLLATPFDAGDPAMRARLDRQNAAVEAAAAAVEKVRKH